MILRLSSSFLALALALGLNSCGPKTPKAADATPPDAPAPVPAAKPEEKKAAQAPAPAPAPEAPAKPTTADKAAPAEGDAGAMAEGFAQFPTAVDIGGFGSDEPVERPDMPERGVLTFGPESWDHSNGAHWETYSSNKFKATRWGRYQVRITYTLNRTALGMQFRMGDLVVKRSLNHAPVARKAYLGTVYIPQPGEVPFSLLTPPTENAHFEIHEIALVPTCEGETPRQAEDGSITLNAKDAITWSENMRYEPKPEKNCLGFWTSADDLAEWEFEVTKPGRYKVTLSQGCGSGNQGSEVELKHAGQSLKFTTEDTGGFQNWKDVTLGEIEIKATGKQRLMIDPVNKAKSAVLDVQKVVLTPVG